MSNHSEIENLIEKRLSEREPELELVAVERPGGGVLRLYVDHPEGVTLAVCERATGYLSDLLEEWSLEVSSPGIERPLTKPDHFRRFLGKTVRVRTSSQIDGQRNFLGKLVAADNEKIALDAHDDGAPVEIRLEQIGRSNLVPNIQGGTA